MRKHFYLFHIQYLGFRYHGWMKQPGISTIESMVEKTARYVLGHSDFKILGASRTDAMVSANHAAFELFVHEDLPAQDLKDRFNRNLPNDIRVLDVELVTPDFNILQSVKSKEYLYFFSFGRKPHPFSASLCCNFDDSLDIELMKTGALLFEGTHDFRRYCTKPGADTQFVRTVMVSEIIKNDQIRSNFIKPDTFCYRVKAKGFMRNQVRLMMGQLLRLGRREIDLAEIKRSLTGKDSIALPFIAPASGLMLNQIVFKVENP